MPEPKPKLLGIIGAMEEEVELLRASLSDNKNFEHASIKYHTGTLAGHAVVLARSGIGKINAALCTQLMIDKFHPDAIIFTGVAGGLLPGCKVGDLVVATHTVQHDYDISAFRGQKGFVPSQTQLANEDPDLQERLEKVLSRGTLRRLEGTQLIEADSRLRALACRAYDDLQKKDKTFPSLYAGIIASGDQFISDYSARQNIQREFGALCAEMEGAATAYACFLNGIPFLILRSLSDTADGAAVVDFPKFCAEAAEYSAKIVKRLVALIHSTLESGIEEEYKWLLNASSQISTVEKKIFNYISELGIKASDWTSIEIQDTYFDTQNLNLASHGCMMRIRRTPGGCWLICKISKTKDAALFKRLELKRPVVVAENQVSWGSTLHGLLKDAPLAEEIRQLTESSEGLDTVEVWNSHPVLTINNNRRKLTLSIGSTGVADVYVDWPIYSNQTVSEKPDGQIEIEVEVVQEPATEADAAIYEKLVTNLPKILNASASNVNKYLRGINKLSHEK